MYFDLTDEQQAIKSTAHDFLAARYKSERIRELAESESGFEQSDWDEMAELGWPGLALPEEWGGQGLGIVELAVLFEEMGYALAPSPLFSNTIAGLALALCGSDEQRERFLRPLAAGELRGTPALWDAGSPATIGEFSMEANADGDGVVLDGEKVLVMDAASGRLLPRRHRRRASPPGRARRRRRHGRPEPSIDPTRRLYSVRFEGVEVGGREHAARRGGRLLPGLPPPLRCPCRRVDRDRPAHDGDGGRLRQRPPAVRPPDRRLPGGLAPLRADAARDRERPLRRLRRRLGRRRRARVAAAGRLDGQGLRLRRRLARARRLDPGPRRHRLHLGARPPLLPQARQGQRGDVRRRQVAPRAGRRRCPDSAPASRPRPEASAGGARSSASPSPRSAPRSPTSRRRPSAPRPPASSASGRRSSSAPRSPRPPTSRGQHREDRRRHRDRLGLHPQPLHPRHQRPRHRRDVGRALPPRPRLGRQAPQRDLAQRRVRQAGAAPARGDRGDAADHAAGRQGRADPLRGLLLRHRHQGLDPAAPGGARVGADLHRRRAGRHVPDGRRRRRRPDRPPDPEPALDRRGRGQLPSRRA